jgi:hypothetical protein
VCHWETRNYSIWFGLGGHARPEYVCEAVAVPRLEPLRPPDPPPQPAPGAPAIIVEPDP